MVMPSINFDIRMVSISMIIIKALSLLTVAIIASLKERWEKRMEK